MIPSMNWSRKLRNCQSFSLENFERYFLAEGAASRQWLRLLPLGTLMMVPRSAAARQFWKWRVVRSSYSWTGLGSMYLGLFLKVESLDLQEVEEGVGLEGHGLARHVTPHPAGLETQSVSQLATISLPWAWPGLWPGLASVYVFPQFT